MGKDDYRYSILKAETTSYYIQPSACLQFNLKVTLSFQDPAASSDPSQLCTHEGFVRDPNDLRVFYQCVKMSGKFIAFRLECPTGLVFDTLTNVCNWKELVQN